MIFSQLPHVASALQHPHNIIFDNEDVLLIHCTVSNVYVAECRSGVEEKLVEDILKLSVIRLQTSNQTLQLLLIPHFKHNYVCEQAVFDNHSLLMPDSNLVLLNNSDLDYTAESYGMTDYINQLYERQRLFGYYENKQFIGYVAFHIDETIGALFVRPEFRRLGYGEKIMSAAAYLYKKENPECVCFAQILADNVSSINLHKKMGCSFSSQIYWVYNEEYTY